MAGWGSGSEKESFSGETRKGEGIVENSSRFFANKDCEYYPCHRGLRDFNCLFCYCPFYMEEKCPGDPAWIAHKDRIIKDCTDCSWPHRPESYDVILRWIVWRNKNRKVSEETMQKARKA